jgi:hypothetical protein
MLLVPLRPGLTKTHKIHLPFYKSLINYAQQVLKSVHMQNLGIFFVTMNEFTCVSAPNTNGQQCRISIMQKLEESYKKAALLINKWEVGEK